MWTRKELKQKAKEALKRNYWRIVLVTFLAVILGGGTPAATSAGGGRTADENQNQEISGEVSNDVEITVYESTSDSGDGALYHMMEGTMKGARDTLYANFQNVSDNDIQIMTISIILTVIFLFMAIFLMVIVYVFIVLLYNPFYMGVCRFMLKSVDDRAEVKETAYGFDHSYKNIVKTMFLTDLRVFLWTLLLIVPGIYKKYQYRMVPYILAEHPDMDYKEALRQSSDIMDGEKWHAFVLDLSFIPWHMLGMITCGLVEMLYVSPYVYLTHAALYRRLCERRIDDEI